MKKLNINDFIERAKNIHSNKYDYSKSIYINSATKIEIICKEHGSFYQKPNDHLNNHGCLKCSGSLKSNTEDFINKANAIHNNKYDYSKVNYINNKIKIEIICKEHGSFYQIPNNHLLGVNCAKCTNNIRYTSEEFINLANNKHGFLYDYSKSIYIGAQKKLIIICKKHGEFLQIPSCHLRGNGCKKCEYDRKSQLFRSSYKDIIERAKSIYNDKYDYSKFIYINSKTNGIIICNKHGEFLKDMKSHIGHNKQGCPKCTNNISKSEIAWLDYLNINEKYRQPKKFKINNIRIVPDAYDPTTNTIYEFYGDFWHGNPNVFDSTKINPMVKKTYGELYLKTMKKEDLIRSANYKLITIWEQDWEKNKWS